MRKLYITIFIIVSLSSFSQRGDFLLTEHYPQQSNIDNTNFEIINDHLGRLCVANRSGVLKYDGEAWDFYKTPSAALSIAVDSSNVVYVGCIGSIGMIDFKEREIIYQPIIQSDTLDDLFLETEYSNGKVYFMGSDRLIEYDTKKKTTKIYNGYYLNIYKLKNKVYVNNSNYETFLLGDSLEKVTPKDQISFADDQVESSALILDFEGKIKIKDGQNFKSVPQNKLIEDRGYEVQEVQWINDSLFVCSTFESGLLFFNIKDPTYLEVTNYHSGLPDNEIFALHTDDNQSVWAAHQFGITQISPVFPAYSFSHFPGLSGNLTSTNTYRDKLWVTTSLGLFYFDRDTIFETKVYYEVEAPKKAAIKPQNQTKSNPKNAEKTKESSRIKRLFNKKKRAQTSEKANQGEKKEKGLFKKIASAFEGKDVVEKVKGKLSKNTKYLRKTRKIPVDIKYVFKKVEGANGKFLDILPYQDRLLAISTTGVYEITGNNADLVIDEEVETFTINDKDQLILSTSNLAVKIFKKTKNVWIEQISQLTGDIIVGMKTDQDGSLWLTGANTVYKSELSDSSFLLLDSYPLNNAYLDRVQLMEVNNRIYFINSQGYYYYNESSNTIVEDEKLKKEIGIPTHHLYDKNGQSTWVYSGRSWYKIDKKGNASPFEYLGLFPDLRSINSSVDSDEIWLVTNKNDLLKYNPNSDGNLHAFNFFVRQVSNEKGFIDQNQNFDLSYDENYLSIQLSKPDFLGLLNPEFQYKLKGLNSNWSEWTKSKTIDFSFLPQGKYELMVRSRDTFGRVEEGSVLSFKVNPPYWQTPWFYAIQMIFFGSLVLLSTRLNQNNSTNRFLSGALTILTLVLIIEFLQSAISSYFTFESTPVIEFLIDAIIAFMIFPLEKVLRELMTHGKIGSLKIKAKGKSTT